MRSLALMVALLPAVVLAPSNANAQCVVRGASFSSYGTSCPTGTANSPLLSGSFIPTRCQIAMNFKAYAGCCNEYLTGRTLMFGLAPANVPLSPYCTLLVQPMVLVTWAPSQGSTLTVNLPRNTSPGSVFVQGIATYYYTLGRRTKYMMTHGLKVTIW